MAYITRVFSWCYVPSEGAVFIAIERCKERQGFNYLMIQRFCFRSPCQPSNQEAILLVICLHHTAFPVYPCSWPQTLQETSRIGLHAVPIQNRALPFLLGHIQRQISKQLVKTANRTASRMPVRKLEACSRWPSASTSPDRNASESH